MPINEDVMVDHEDINFNIEGDDDNHAKQKQHYVEAGSNNKVRSSGMTPEREMSPNEIIFPQPVQVNFKMIDD